MARGTPRRSRRRQSTASAIATGAVSVMMARSISCRIRRRSACLATASCVWAVLSAMAATLEGWVEVQAAVLGELPFAWVYFLSFVFVAVFVVVNLFIAVVLNNLESAKIELQAAEDRRNPHHGLLTAIEEVKARLEELERGLREQPMAEPGAERAPHPRAPHPTLSPEGRG
jgi:hypothetical protein